METSQLASQLASLYNQYSDCTIQEAVNSTAASQLANLIANNGLLNYLSHILQRGVHNSLEDKFYVECITSVNHTQQHFFLQCKVFHFLWVFCVKQANGNIHRQLVLRLSVIISSWSFKLVYYFRKCPDGNVMRSLFIKTS